MWKKQGEIKKIWSRVDLQVSLLVFAVTLCATLITSTIYWNYTFHVMISTLEERVYSLYDAIEDTLNMDTFLDINDVEDMDAELYQNAKEYLLSVKNASGVLYLYTAKEDEEGNLVYVIDGLEEDQDFRYPGDLIEEEIVDDMRLALSGVNVVPDEIVHTDWGDIFVAYLPVHDENGEILGVVGIEFDASVTYVAYQHLMWISPAIILLLSLVASYLSMRIFKRISNPFYLDMANQDTPTRLKNRNAYEVDIHNMIARGQNHNTGVVMIDINNLKKVNDKLGHNIGDNYIRIVAKAIKESLGKNMVAYRIGGDEFVTLVQDTSSEELKSYMLKCSEKVNKKKLGEEIVCSISCGYCMFDGTLDKDLEDTYRRADEAMYYQKRRQKAEGNDIT